VDGVGVISANVTIIYCLDHQFDELLWKDTL